MSNDLGFNNHTRTPYTPPAPGSSVPPAPPVPPAAPRSQTGQTGRGGGWIMLLRVFLWLFFAVICLAGLITGGALFMQALDYEEPALLFAGIGTFLGCVFLAFVSVAGGMVALDAAQNIRRCAINSANILDLLNRQAKR